jgi:hypothetical protein
VGAKHLGCYSQHPYHYLNCLILKLFQQPQKWNYTELIFHYILEVTSKYQQSYQQFMYTKKTLGTMMVKFNSFIQ